MCFGRFGAQHRISSGEKTDKGYSVIATRHLDDGATIEYDLKHVVQMFGSRREILSTPRRTNVDRRNLSFDEAFDAAKCRFSFTWHFTPEQTADSNVCRVDLALAVEGPTLVVALFGPLTRKSFLARFDVMKSNVAALYDEGDEHHSQDPQ